MKVYVCCKCRNRYRTVPDPETEVIIGICGDCSDYILKLPKEKIGNNSD